jgi:hypothetical protein
MVFFDLKREGLENFSKTHSLLYKILLRRRDLNVIKIFQRLIESTKIFYT